MKPYVPQSDGELGTWKVHYLSMYTFQAEIALWLLVMVHYPRNPLRQKDGKFVEIPRIANHQT